MSKKTIFAWRASVYRRPSQSACDSAKEMTTLHFVVQPTIAPLTPNDIHINAPVNIHAMNSSPILARERFFNKYAHIYGKRFLEDCAAKCTSQSTNTSCRRKLRRSIEHNRILYFPIETECISFQAMFGDHKKASHPREYLEIDGDLHFETNN